ncbi:RnfABCDGE type electron transport complex subunit G [bacterium]|nr:RnfABCDGE type electron transport complex subunit G [bacterium]
MKEIVKFAAILMLVAVIASGALAYVNKITLPRIIAQQDGELTNGLKSVLPGTENGVIEPVEIEGEIVYYKGFADKKKMQPVGFAMLAVNYGYSSDIRTLFGVDTSFVLLATNILSQNETPGLGTKCEEIKYGDSSSWWQEQFIGKFLNELKVDKDGGQIQSITGATITSRAITNSISQSLTWLKEEITENNQYINF